MSDKPTIHATLDDIEAEGKPEAFVFATKQGKRVTFPDVFAMDWIEGEKFLDDLSGDKSNSEVMKRWLSDKDYQTLRDAGISLRGMGVLIQRVMNHYQGVVGTPGEGDASKS